MWREDSVIYAVAASAYTPHTLFNREPLWFSTYQVQLLFYLLHLRINIMAQCQFSQFRKISYRCHFENGITRCEFCPPNEYTILDRTIASYKCNCIDNKQTKKKKTIKVQIVVK